MQAWTLRAQLRHAETIERPWLIGRVEGVTDTKRGLRDITEILGASALPSTTPVVVRGIVTNRGAGQGWMTKSLPIPTLRFVKHPIEQSEPTSETTMRQMLAPCAQAAMPPGQDHGFEAYHPLTPDEHAQIRAGSASLIFMALFEYRSAKRRFWTRAYSTHETWFTWEWTCYPTVDPSSPIRASGQVHKPEHWIRYT